MTFRYYIEQLAKMEPSKRQQLEDCASVRTENWIDVPKECLEPTPSQGVTTGASKFPTGAPKPSDSYRPAPSLTGGPGDLAKVILEKLGIKPTVNCGCGAMRQRMNEWGWRGCWQQRDEIVGWFATKAADVGSEIGVGSIARAIATELRRRMTGK